MRILSLKGTSARSARLNYYHNHSPGAYPHARRDEEPLRDLRDTAIGRDRHKLVHLRDTLGGRTLAYFGGGGQGNHLAGPYGKALRTAMRTRNYYSALAQEKTGGFWVDGRLYGKQNCHATEDVENAEVVVFIGTNPWQSHGIRTRASSLREIHKDPNRR